MGVFETRNGESMATVEQESCLAEIGAAAGKVWHVLDEHGPLTIAKLVKEMQEPRDVVMQALGWLCAKTKLKLKKTAARGRFRCDSCDCVTASLGPRSIAEQARPLRDIEIAEILPCHGRNAVGHGDAEWCRHGVRGANTARIFGPLSCSRFLAGCQPDVGIGAIASLL